MIECSEQSAELARVDLSGSVTIQEAKKLRDLFSSLLPEKPKKLEANLQGLEETDIAVLQVLRAAKNAAESAGILWSVRADESSREDLKICGYADLLADSAENVEA